MKEAESGIENMLNTIQAGILTSSTKERLEAQKELEIRITEEKLAKPKLSADFVKFWLTRFRKLNPQIKNHRETLVNTFVSAIYLYDDKILLTFNYKEGTKTISLDDVATLAASGESGSDLGCFAPPKGKPPPYPGGGSFFCGYPEEMRTASGLIVEFGLMIC